MLGLKLNHVSKRGSRALFSHQGIILVNRLLIIMQMDHRLLIILITATSKGTITFVHHLSFGLTHWPLEDLAVILIVYLSNTFCGSIIYWALLVKFLSSECYRTSLMISQNLHQVIAWCCMATSQVLWQHIASMGYNGLTCSWKNFHGIYSDVTNRHGG